MSDIVYLPDGLGSVELLDHMGSDLTVVNAARVSLGKESKEFTQRDADLIQFLANARPVPHSSPFRHPIVQLRVEAPIFIARQWFRHYVGATKNEESRRYIEHQAPPLWTPSLWRNNQGESFQLEPLLLEAVDELVSMSMTLYESLLAEGVAGEQARTVLLQGAITRFVDTGSLWYWYSFVTQRAAPNAQREIQEFAKVIDMIMGELFPVSWATLRCRNED